MALRLYNTLTAQVEEFQPVEGNRVRMYTCGPTVYDYAHIGNFRTFVFQDILRRYLRYRGYEVRQVMNLTDVDDKTIRNAREAGLELREFTAKYIEAFEVDRKLLNLETPEFLVRATDHIPEMIKLVQTLAEKGYTYQSEGSIYFRVEKFKDYGKLSKIDLSGMAMKYLVETFDIHSGGTDLAFPHHENEISQSEAATGKPFARFWLHGEHLMVNGQRMAKSSGNFYTLRDLIDQDYKPTAIRYLLSEVPFRKPLNFTFDGLHQAQKSLERLRNFRYRLTMEKFAVGESAGLRARAA